MIHINNTPVTNYKNLEIVEEVNGSLVLSFTSFNYENKAHTLLKEESIVTVNDYDFKIKQIGENQYAKQVNAVSTFFNLSGERTDKIYGGTKKISDFIEWTFKNINWSYSMDQDIKDDYVLIANYGNDNYLKLIQGLCAATEIEYKIMPNNHVHFAKKIGPDNDAQYRYGHNIKTLDRQVDTTNLATKIVGYGANGLKVAYTSPNAEKFGIIEAEPISDERFTIANNLVEYIKKELNDEPEIAITLDTIELLDKDLGESVWLIYEPLDITIKSRILSKTTTIQSGQLKTKSVVIGNIRPSTSTDMFVQQKIEIDENKKQTMSYFEQTNDKIRLAIEETDGKFEKVTTEFELTAGQIRSEIKSLENDVEIGMSSLTQTVEGFEFQVNGLSKEINSVSGEVDRLDTRVSIQAGQISSKVSRGEVISEINQSPERVKIKASQIEMEGITQLNGNVYLGSGGVNQSYVMHFGGSGVTLDATGGRLNIATPLGYTRFLHNIQVDERATFDGLTTFTDRVNINGTFNVYNQTAGQTGKVCTGPREMWVGFTNGRLRMSDGNTTYYFTPD
ncbi:phage tail protein [Savagea sp. SN6]|uniref:Phage tail protein n=1 Tax=Savagea serpentis TaxID=2785297 RepID=A0A8J7GB47_9BACL|nr:phage tail protein [Savagea serpentis]MBF4500241.1 phage tail protein [Savagea serpentis]